MQLYLDGTFLNVNIAFMKNMAKVDHILPAEQNNGQFRLQVFADYLMWLVMRVFNDENILLLNIWTYIFHEIEENWR